jgi:anti-anti-sigma factor
MKIALDNVTGILILRVSGDMRIWGHEDAQERMLNLLRAQETPPNRLILSLSHVHHIDTAGVGALARVLIECGKHETELKVVPPGGFPGQMLKRIHLFDAWSAFPDETTAIQASLGSAAAG